MRWYALLSLLSDGRVKFLLWFVIIAIVVAIVLTLIEIRLKKKKERHLAKKVDESVIEKMKRFLKHDKTAREKLDFVDKAAKEYFKGIYGTPANSGYSMLIQEFEKTKRKNELAFCKEMFSTYYSHNELTDDRVVALGDLLIDVERRKKKADEISKIPSFAEKVDRFFAGSKRKMLRQRKVREENNHIKRIEKKKEESTKKRGGVSWWQKMKDNYKIKRLMAARDRDVEKIQAKKVKEVVKKEKIRKDVAEKKSRELIRQKVIYEKLVAKRAVVVAKRNKVQAKVIRKRNKVVETKEKKFLAAKTREKSIAAAVGRRKLKIEDDKNEMSVIESHRKILVNKKDERAKKITEKLIGVKKKRFKMIALNREKKILKKKILEVRKLELINKKRIIETKEERRIEAGRKEGNFEELKEFRVNKDREEKAIVKAVVAKEKIDKGDKEAIIAIKKAREEKVLLKRNLPEKKNKFWDIFGGEKKAEKSYEGERTIGVAERIVNSARVRAEKSLLS